MFRTKKEVDNHITTILSRTCNDNDRLLKGYNFARLYFQVEDYETAKRHLMGFLSLKENHALGHKLMGQIHEATSNLEHALQSYKRSLELDPNQKELVLKICQLYTQIPVDQETAKYWLERGESLFPHNEVIFKLKELMVKSDASCNHQEELERLIKSEMAASPSVALVSKLLKLYLSQNRAGEAYGLAVEEERKGAGESLSWYSLLVDICKARLEELSCSEVDPALYTNYLYFLNKAATLALAEPHARKDKGGAASSSHSAPSILHLMDQVLYLASHLAKAAHEGWPYLLTQMKGQLYFHLAALVLKGATRERGRDAQRLGAGLLLVAYCFKPGRIAQESWFHNSNGNHSEQHRLLVEVYRLSVARHLQAALVLNTLAAHQDPRLWISKLKAECCIPQVQERIYHRAFESLAQAKFSTTSFFLTDPAFTNSTLEFPHLASLQECFREAQQVHAASLHHLVWLALGARSAPTATRLPFPFQLFSSLHYSCHGLSNACPESLCQLDMEAFLHATMQCAQTALDRRGALIAPQAAQAPLSVPPDIAQPLCTPQQAEWWTAAHSLVNNAAREKISHLRRTLQHGLEVIRGVGNHGLEVSLVVYLARVFADKVTDAKEEGGKDTSPLEARAAHYWQLALEMVAKLEKGTTLRCPKEALFPPSGAGPPDPEELAALREEGELYLALHAMNLGQLEEAAAKFDKLASPHASYYLALCLKQLEEKGSKPGALRRDPASHHATQLLTRARNALYLTLDRLRGDPDHPLHREVPRELEEVETRLTGQDSRAAASNDTDDSGPPSPCSPPVYHPKHHNNTSQSYYTPPSRPQRPNMEKLESQLKALTLSQESMNQTLIEQNKCLVENTKAILEEMKNISSSILQVEHQLTDLRDLANSLKKGFKQGSPKMPLENLEDDLDDFGEGELDEAGGHDWMYHPSGGGSIFPGYQYGPPPPPPHLGPEMPAAMGYSPLYHHYPGMAVGPRSRPPFYPHIDSTGLPFTESHHLPHFQFNLQPAYPPVPPTTTEAAATTPTSKPHSFQIPMPASSSPASALPPTFLQTTAAMLSSPTLATMPAMAAATSPHKPFFSPPQQKPERQRMDSERSDTLEPTHDPFPDYKPLVPLPDKVDVHTGEENEIVLFEERAKLFRMVDKEWKERGTGIIKILQGDSGKYRLVMRRDQVFKICANHCITEEMQLMSMSNSDKAWIWAAQDYADEVVQQERFCIRFKTSELAKSFKDVVDKCIESIKATSPEAAAPKTGTSITKPTLGFGTSFLPKLGSWNCPACLVNNPEHQASCMACATPKPGASAPKTEVPITKPTLGFGTSFLPKPGSWNCPACLVNNPEHQASCMACTTPKPGAAAPKTEAPITKPGTATSPFFPKFWVCKVCNLSNPSDKATCDACQSSKPFGASSATAAKLSFGGGPGEGGDVFAKLASTRAASISQQTQMVSSSPAAAGGVFGAPEKPLFSQVASSGKNLFGQLPDKPSFGSFNSEKPIFGQSENSSDKPLFGSLLSGQPAVKPVFGQTPPSGKTNFGKPLFGQTPPSIENTGFGKPIFGQPPTSVEKTGIDKPIFGQTPLSGKTGFGQPVFGQTPTSMEKTGFGQPVFGQTPTSSEKTGFAQPVFGPPPSMEKTGFGQPIFGQIPTSSEKSGFNKPIFGQTPTSSEKTGFGQPIFGQTPTTGEKSGFGQPVFGQTSTSSEKIGFSQPVFGQTTAKNEKLLFGKPPPIFSQATPSESALFGNFSAPPISEAEAASSFSLKDSNIPTTVSQEGKPSFSFLTPPATETTTAGGRDIKLSAKSTKQDSTETKTNPFSKFSFSTTPKSTGPINIDGKKEPTAMGASPEISTSKPHHPQGDTSTTSNKKEDSVEEFIPTAEFKPVVPLPELVELKTGEEDEEVLFKEKAKLFRFDSEEKQWKEKGRGEMKILKNSKTGKFRVLMRRDQVLKVCANHFILPEIKLQPLQKSDNTWSWDSFNMEDDEVKPEKLAVRFSNKDLAQKFKKVFEECQDKIPNQVGDQLEESQESWECETCLSNNDGDISICNTCTSPKAGFNSRGEGKDPIPLSQIFKPEEGSWECPDCYLRNAAKDVVCIACGLIKPGDSKPSGEATSVFNFGGSTSGFSFSTPKKDGFIFGQVPQTSVPEPPGKLVFGSLSSAKLSDPAVSSSTQEQQKFKFGSPQKYEFNFEGVMAKSPVKALRSPDTSRDEDESGEVSETDVIFQPVIPLPPKVAAKTGEEEEVVLYSHRAKLFRYWDGEWKERGIGDVKILLHPETGRLRLLMRRDQILKLCLNHLLPATTGFVSRGEKAWTWTAKDYSDLDHPGHEYHFTLRFKSAEISQEFKEALDKALEGKASSSSGDSSKEAEVISSPPSTASSHIEKSSPPSEEPKKSEQAIDSMDKDVEITYEKTASPEQVERALSLQLPKNFYLYEIVPPCPGCRGCNDEIPDYVREDDATVDEKPSVDQAIPKTADDKPSEKAPSNEEDQGLLLEKKGMSFADLVKQNSGQDFISSTLAAKKSSFEFPGAGKQVFGSSSAAAAAEGGEDEVPSSTDPHFEPIIPLPDLVEVRTGEEEEIAIFSERAKLFRFDNATQQWKERGIGEMKILQHRQQPCRYRLLLRREQVHKVVCNHLIVEGTHLSPMATSNNSLCWVAQDYSENPQGNLEKFAIRFKNTELKEKFEKTYNDCLRSLKENEPLPGMAPGLPSQSEVEAAVASIVEEEESTSCQNLRAQLTSSEEGGFVMVGQEDNSGGGGGGGEEEEEDVDSEEDLDKMIMLEDQVVFSIFDTDSNSYKPCGKGKLQVIYDEEVYGARISIFSEATGELFSDHHIAVQTSLRVEGLSGYWAAMDNALEPPQRRRICCRFSSKHSLDNFIKSFEEGKELAVQAEIVENQEFLPMSLVRVPVAQSPPNEDTQD